MKTLLIALAPAFILLTAMAGPAYQMNKAFNALSDLVPFLVDKNAFMEKKSEPTIQKSLAALDQAFRLAKHDTLLKTDLFTPSYLVIRDNLADSSGSFKSGNKDYAFWRLKEITAACIDCHTRLPVNYTSSFQNGELRLNEGLYKDPYSLGVSYLIVRRYPDAKASFLRAIQDQYIRKNYSNLIRPFKQLLLIDAKVLRSPENLKATLKAYEKKSETPTIMKLTLQRWLKRVEHWEKKTLLQEGLKSEVEAKRFLTQDMVRLKNTSSWEDSEDVDLLFATGLLSRYLFEHPESLLAGELNYWLGWAEKRLQRDQFFGTGDLFLKQCLQKYPKSPVARECLKEYEESIIFEFSGSRGTDIPPDIKKELEDFRRSLQ